MFVTSIRKINLKDEYHSRHTNIFSFFKTNHFYYMIIINKSKKNAFILCALLQPKYWIANSRKVLVAPVELIKCDATSKNKHFKILYTLYVCTSVRTN
jgi:hypothetical protein